MPAAPNPVIQTVRDGSPASGTATASDERGESDREARPGEEPGEPDAADLVVAAPPRVRRVAHAPIVGERMPLPSPPAMTG